MTEDSLLELLENYNLIKIEIEFDEVFLILDVEQFKVFYNMILEYILSNDIYLKAITEVLFSLNITEILEFYQIDKNILK